MFITYVIVNTLSFVAVVNLFTVIHCIFARPVIPGTRYLIGKLFNPSHCTTFHGLCTDCDSNIGTFTRSDKVKKCNTCNIEVNVKSSAYKEFFITLDPSSQIAYLLEANKEYYN